MTRAIEDAEAMKQIHEENQLALLSIGGLSRLCGVPVETLRTWERRYGWPVPIRLDSGHRRYPFAFVIHLRLVRRALDVGFKASFAVAAPQGELEIAVQQAMAVEETHRKTPVEIEYEKEVARWIEKADAWDASGLDVSLRRSWAHYGARRFAAELVARFIDVSGDRCRKDEDAGGHAHYACDVISRFLARQWQPLSNESSGVRSVVAGLESTSHPIGIHMAALFLALNGFEVICLGPNTPIRDIVHAAIDSSAVTVAIQLTPTSDLARCSACLSGLRDALPASVAVSVCGNSDIGKVTGISYIESFDDFYSFAQSLAEIHIGVDTEH